MQNENSANVAECHVRGTDYCDLLARGDCSVCPAEKLSVSDREKLMDYVDAVRGMLPDSGLQSLYEPDECLLCKHSPNAKTCYATVDYAHIDPVVKLPGMFGVRTNSKVGSIVPLQIACCERCKKNVKKRGIILPVCIGAGMIIGLLLGLIQPLRHLVARVHPVMPLVAFVLLSLIGWGVGEALKRRFDKKARAETVMDLRDLPFIKEMEALGWFPLMGKGKKAKPVFSKERLKRGWFA